MVHYDDEIIKKYLLGSLPVEEAEAMEVAIATNGASFDRLCDVECELVDDYLSKRLSARETERFEKEYLITAPRIERFQIAQELKRMAGRRSVERSPAIRRVSFAAAAGVGVLSLLLGVSYFLLRTTGQVDPNAVAAVNDEPRRTVAEPESDPRPVIVSTPESRSPLVNASPTSPVKTTPSRAPVIAAAVSTFKVSLLPGGLRGETEQSISIPVGAKAVAISLKSLGPVDRFSRFRAVVRTPENEVVLSTDDLATPKFTIDASKLENRTYIISLEGENESNELESIADYTFRVRR